jgi:hypothetical protein
MHALRRQLVVIFLLAGLGAVHVSAQPRLPERGLDRSAVEARFGAPERIEGPVGEPPITKWIYAEFIAVFEYDHVVHTVIRKPIVEQGPVGGSAIPPTSSTTSPLPGTAPPASAVGESSSTDSTGNPPAESTTGDILSLPQ